MADEAFALSPINARAAQPSEQDYDAIQEAFMETSRGRWFLGEYAKRNRNADTRMVLDAVARIEDTLAASEKPVRDPVLDQTLLDQFLASLRTALTEAREAATAAVGDLALEQNLTPVRKGARIIREISWRWREIGADGRICDLIDSQLTAIEAAAGKLSPADLAAALSGAFDRIEEKIASFDADSEAASAAAPKAPPTAKTPPAETWVEPEVEPTTASESSFAVASDAISEPADSFDATDEAMLDMIAMEMAAPDTDAAYETETEETGVEENQVHEAQVEQTQIQETRIQETRVQETEVQILVASYEIDVTFPEARDAPEEPVTATVLPAATPLQPASEPEPEPEPSLGSSLLANGIVSRPRISKPDPLAPIRRMSQTEKIAFFS